MDRAALSSALLRETHFAGVEQARLMRAMDLGDVLHRDQVRHETTPDGRVNPPYFEHPLRNTLRLVRWGVRDLDVLIASILHDTVEDCGQVYVAAYTSFVNVPELEARELLSSYLLRTFGFRVHQLVLGVTNPYYTRKEWNKFSAEEKRVQYVEKVAKAISIDAGVFLVKLADFIDNAGSLHWIPEDRASVALRLAGKYLPLVGVFHAHFDIHDFRGLVPDVEVLRTRLVETEARLHQILDLPLR